MQSLSVTKSWNKLDRRQTYVSDAQLPAWFKALDSLTANATSENAADAQGFRDYLELLLRTGLRRSEAEGLEWATVDMGAKVFKILDPKNGHDLTLPMASQVFALFERRFAATGGKGLVFAGDGKGRGKSAGATGKLGNTRAMLDAAKAGARVDFSQHDLRRTFGTLGDSLGFSLLTIKRLLNHATGNDVTAGYIMQNPERLRKPLQAISDEIDRLAFPADTVQLVAQTKEDEAVQIIAQ